MNIKIAGICAGLCLITLSCGDEPASEAPSSGGELRFTVSSPRSRLAYEGLYSTLFEDNDTIGCVIAQKNADGSYSYKGNSCWHYKSGVLVLDRIEIRKTFPNQWPSEKNVMCPYTDADNTLISRTTEQAEDGYLTLKDSSINYAFFFYYPYVNYYAIYENISNAIDTYEAYNSTPFYHLLEYPNWATNEDLSTTNQWGGKDELNKYKIKDYYLRYYFCGDLAENTVIEASWSANVSKYGWTEWPCFVNRVQTNKRQIENSDFLWIAYTSDKKGKGDINATTATYEVDLEFKKKTAVIEVDCDAPLSEVTFQGSDVLTGTHINLQTGTRSTYTNSNESDKQKNRSTSGKFFPYRLSDSRYRLILPPQETFDCDLNFTLGGKAYTVALEENLTKLEEGKIYIIHINKAGGCTLKINDWSTGSLGVLEEVK